MQEELRFLSTESRKKQEATAKEKAAIALTGSRLKRITDMNASMDEKIQLMIHQQNTLKANENNLGNNFFSAVGKSKILTYYLHCAVIAEIMSERINGDTKNAMLILSDLHEQCEMMRRQYLVFQENSEQQEIKLDIILTSNLSLELKLEVRHSNPTD
jgi:hypothetical protein